MDKGSESGMSVTTQEELQSIRPSTPTLFGRLGGLGEAVVELLVDRDLRRKAGTLVVTEAGKRIKGIQEGVASRAGTIQRGLGEGPRQVQSLYARIQHQYLASRHAASLKARRDTPVDVQVGPFLWEDAPQELRSRLWIALLCNPHLIGNLVEEKEVERKLQEAKDGSPQHRGSRPHTPSRENESHASRSRSASSSPSHKSEGSDEQAPQDPFGDCQHKAHIDGGMRESKATEADGSPSSPAEENGSSHSSGSPAASPAANHTSRSSSCSLDSLEGDSAAGRMPSAASPDDAWEIVQDGTQLNDFRGSQLRSAELQSGANGPMTLRNRLLEAVCKVAWPISTVYPEGCRYDTLCQISIGQEEVEEVIQRDINRTFPEHPQFSFEQGQQELFRVLKAYSLHDLQVGYCQGMAFVTGMILMYIPEEPAFRLLTRLMDERGANLRQLYLPGLEGLKNYLRMFEWLMNKTTPDLREHLEEYGVVPVLYASQWFLTAFSCPFPTVFSCRVVDVMLTENCGHAMLRVGLAVIKACRPALMELHDFEDLVTHLKVEPVKWTQQKSRDVLNEAIEGSITDELLAAASEAVSDGYEGSLARRTSVLRKEGSGELKAKDARQLSLQHQVSRRASSSGRLGQLKEELNSTAAGPDLTGTSEQDLDAETGDMMLALDALWVGDAATEAASPSQA